MCFECALYYTYPTIVAPIAHAPTACFNISFYARECRWLDTKITCPICRKPIVDSQPPEDETRGYPGAPSGPEAAAGFGRRGGWNADLLSMELMFRLAMLRQQYPQYITDDMVQDWGQQAQQVGRMVAGHRA